MKDLVFDKSAFEDLSYWLEKDLKILIKIFKLLKEIARSPKRGTGKPELLKGDLSGMWSRIINHEHRIVCEIQSDKIKILACRYHYDNFK